MHEGEGCHFLRKILTMPKMGQMRHYFGPKSTLLKFFLICSLAFSEIVPNDRYLKVGKSDRLGFLRTFCKFKKWRKSVVFSSKIGMG